jgi:hypothetical protein
MNTIHLTTLKRLSISAFIIFNLIHTQTIGQSVPISQASYLFNRAPFRQNPYIELPLGTIIAKGWLTDNLDKLYHFHKLMD